MTRPLFLHYAWERFFFLCILFFRITENSFLVRSYGFKEVECKLVYYYHHGCVFCEQACSPREPRHWSRPSSSIWTQASSEATVAWSTFCTPPPPPDRLPSAATAPCSSSTSSPAIRRPKFHLGIPNPSFGHFTSRTKSERRAMAKVKYQLNSS